MIERKDVIVVAAMFLRKGLSLMLNIYLQKIVFWKTEEKLEGILLKKIYFFCLLINFLVSRRIYILNINFYVLYF